ncbi:MAG: DUF4846 domain-containing protein [Bacteroidota bacterium]
MAKTSLLLFLSMLLHWACTSEPQNNNPQSEAKPSPQSIEVKEERNPDKRVDMESIAAIDSSQHNVYAWMEEMDPKHALLNRMVPPKGFERIEVEKGDFADWLRYLPLKEAGSPVRLYDGALKGNQKVHEAVVDIDIGNRDLQQCADAVMRLKAEYHFSKAEFDQIHFNYTSGDKVAFADWAKGRKPIIEGRGVRFSSASGTTDYTYANFKKYLIQIYSYAGTASLSKELEAIPSSKLRAGDVFIQGGFPGHAVLVLDVAENAAGERVFLIGQSYMPAQNIHILKNKEEEGLSPWYRVQEEGNFYSPEWTFDWGDLKRFVSE